MDNLFCGNLFSSTIQWRSDWPPVYPAPLRQIVLVTDSWQRDQHSGILRFVIGIVPESRSPSSRNGDRFHPGLVIGIIPEQ
jgi:hypothetical protein